MKRFIRRLVTSAMLSLSIVGATGAISYAQDKVVRIGFQKYGKLVLLKSKGTLEGKLKAEGYQVVWTEFPSGPPLLEALNVGAIDFGNTGEAPPIFAQAAGAPIQYVAYEPPAPKGEAILVPKDSKIASVADLKGRKVALNKGSNVHYLLVKALEQAELKYSDIEPVFLAPADARAAFERGAIDAWVIWDPFQAAAEAATGARTLADGSGIVSNYQFYFASKTFIAADPKIVDLVLAQLSEVDAWAKGDIHAVAEQLAPAIGLPVGVVEVALKRQAYGIKPVTDSVIADQQQVADTFFALGLIPKSIKISDAARRPGT
jgi:sulfonate transport system substrate-binding protein